ACRRAHGRHRQTDRHSPFRHITRIFLQCGKISRAWCVFFDCLARYFAVELSPETDTGYMLALFVCAHDCQIWRLQFEYCADISHGRRAARSDEEFTTERNLVL